jgi:DNA helicase-2/ATP-dependent DNA helicase PcrA
MPITPQQIQAAVAVQHAAARDASGQVRLIAGPGTGKSYSIEERVCWLLSNGVLARAMAVVSFTRASATDLRTRIHTYCINQGLQTAADVRVTTLHSLALRMLRAAGLLAYPADPLVLDSWEVEHIFDAEFGSTEQAGKRRSEEIRREHEAFWSTGVWAPPNYVPPDPAITAAERAAFTVFHGPRTQLYSCVLPGEIVRQALDHILAGNLDPVALIHLAHLVVDEYQDLNPIDQQFVDELIARGVTTFIAGDDDQSIYSFRYASPSGIQTFPQRHTNTGQHNLDACFRCTPGIVAAATSLITAYASPNRIPKGLTSLYGNSVPPVAGVVHRWRFRSALSEAESLASSAKTLIDAGLSAHEILILISNQRELLPTLRNALNFENVPFVPPKNESFTDTEVGRFVLALIRIVCNMHDYVAHRIALGLKVGVGLGTCNGVAERAIDNAVNYRDLFYNPMPAGVFSARQIKALDAARTACGQLVGWQRNDTLGQRLPDISGIITAAFSAAEAANWQTFAGNLPQQMTLEELQDWLWADTDEQQNNVLASMYSRLNQPVPTGNALPSRVRIMTMHGAKGLSARVVFIPGLEEQIFPGPWRQPYPGLVLEAARLLYVSITRARAACVVSYSQRRMVQGQFLQMAPSRFTTALAGAFGQRNAGLNGAEIQAIMDAVGQL